jgi:hypothetical protein
MMCPGSQFYPKLIKPISWAPANGKPQTPDPKTFDPPPGGPPQQETTMKNLMLAAIAALSLGVGVANAQSLSHSAPPAQTQGQSWYSFGTLANPG